LLSPHRRTDTKVKQGTAICVAVFAESSNVVGTLGFAESPKGHKEAKYILKQIRNSRYETKLNTI